MFGRLFGVITIAIAGSFLVSCAELDEASKSVAETVTPRDVVTGKRTLNIESEQDELERATSQTQQILSEAKQQNVPVDTGQVTLARLRDIVTRTAKVSHRPQLPWEVHVIESPTVNAFTIGGGKIFVFRGLLGGLVNPQDTDELAAVLAHEMAHDTCRHMGKSLSAQAAAALSAGVRKSTGSQMYQASFTSIQEDEADRVGLLYMALAGYDPRAAPRVWQRAHEKYGSAPGNYTYDHSLNIDRMRKVASLVPIALQYYAGEGVMNPAYDRLRVENELVPRAATTSGESGFAALLEGALGTYSDYLNAKNEERARQLAMQQAEGEAQQVAQYTRIAFQFADTQDGHRGIFGEFQNASNRVIDSANIAIYYVDAADKVVYAQPVNLEQLNLSPGQVAKWSVYLLNVPGAQSVRAAVIRAQLAQ